MTQTTEAPAGADSTDRVVETWLAEFGEALSAGDTGRAAGMFEAEGCWRDFVSFTWNLRTLEGRGEIRDMLDAQLAAVAPSGWALDEPASEADGVTEAWIVFFDFDMADS